MSDAPGRCDRCGRQTACSIMSMFNTQTICLRCKQREESHPDYPVAVAADEAAIKSGNLNFQGVGLPEDLQ